MKNICPKKKKSISLSKQSLNVQFTRSEWKAHESKSLHHPAPLVLLLVVKSSWGRTTCTPTLAHHAGHTSSPERHKAKQIYSKVFPNPEDV